MKIHERILRTIDGALTKVQGQGVRSPYPTFYWPTQFKVVTQAFGINSQWYEPYGLPGHEGIDMRAPAGSDIYAVWSGVVSRAGNHPAYGNHIRLSHTIRGIEYESIYAHFDNKIPLHQVGDPIQRGQLIGFADNTGNSYGSHLHFSLKQFNGKRPDTYLQNKFDWPYNMIDPTLFFRETRYGYE